MGFFNNNIRLVLLTLALAGLSSIASAQSKAQFPFYVYKDKGYFNHFAASGFMPDGKCVAINDAWTNDCNGNESCIQSKYDRDCSVMDMTWAGIFWLSPANNWGDIKGGFNLTGAKRLVFWARGEKGGEVVTFKMGGVGMGHPYHDSDSAATDPVTLTKDWKKYSIDLSGKDLSHIIGGFAWVANVKDNPSNITFYLADIYYE